MYLSQIQTKIKEEMENKTLLCQFQIWKENKKEWWYPQIKHSVAFLAH